MLGLMIRDIFSLRKKIYLMGGIMGVCNIALLIVALVLKSKKVGQGTLEMTELEKWFKGGIMLISFLAMLVVFFMVSIVVTDKQSRWEKLLMAFPLTGTQKGAARYFTFFLISMVTGIVQLVVTCAMFNILKFDIQQGTIKFVFCPIAIGLVFVYVRMIFEYIQNTHVAVEYCGILAFLMVGGCIIIYKFGDIDFPARLSDIIKVYMGAFDKWLIYLIPCLMALGVLLASDRMVKPKGRRKAK